MELATHCFVCHDYMENEWRIGLSGLQSQHSPNQPLTALIESLLGHALSNQDIHNRFNSICASCVGRLEDYDWQIAAAERCKREMHDLLLQSVKQRQLEADSLENAAKDVESIEESLDIPVSDEAETVQVQKEVIAETTEDEDDWKLDHGDHYSGSEDSDNETLDKRPHSKFFGLGESNIRCVNMEKVSKRTAIAYRTRERRMYTSFMQHEESANNADSEKEPGTSSRPKSHECSECGEIFSKRIELRQHEKWHRDEARKFRCKTCHYMAPDEDQFTDHVKLHESSDRLECVICKAKRNDIAGIRRHMKIHEGMRNFQCDLCGKLFSHAGSLRVHTRYHMDVRTIECSICPMKFVEKAHLTRHMRTHTLEKPFACPVCDRRFANRYNMRSHERRHTSEPSTDRKFSCLRCKLTFRSSDALNSHNDKIHPIHERYPNFPKSEANEVPINEDQTLE